MDRTWYQLLVRRTKQKTQVWSQGAYNRTGERISMFLLIEFNVYWIEKKRGWCRELCSQ